VPEDPSVFEVWAAGGLKGWQQRQLEQNLRHVALMSGLEQLVAHLGGILDASRGAPPSDVLYQGTLLIPANGFLERTWEQPYQSIALYNAGASAITVQNSGISTAGFAPAQGSGLVTIPAGVMRVFNLRGTAITIYGTAGAAVDICVYARPREPSAGVGAAGGGQGTTSPQLLAVPSPAAGAQWSANPSPNAPFQLQTLAAKLATDAVVGSRFPAFAFTSGGVQFSLIQTTFAVPASNAEFYWLAQGGENPDISVQPEYCAPLPSIWLPAGTIVSSQSVTFDAGDQWSGIVLTYRTAQ
jgi:hypothetical protein